MRNKTDSWPTKGQTKDHGAGSRAKGIFSGLDENQTKQATTLYAKLVRVLGNTPDNVCQAALFAAASEFGLDYIIEKSIASAPVVLTASEEAWQRVKAEQGASTWTMEQGMASFTVHSAAIKAERKVLAVKRAANKAHTEALAFNDSNG